MQKPAHTRDYVPSDVIDTRELFARVEHAYDLNRMRETRIVFFGGGGARAFADDLARAGTHEFVLVDGDTVSATNIATQQVRYAEIGRPKVDCIADQLREINPNVRVRAVRRMLDDAMTDDELHQLAFAPFEEHEAPKQVLLCGFTDDFYAQARVNRFALETGSPALYAQVYREGRGVELVFTHPEVTPACARCALRSRYKAHLERQPDAVTSHGTPISTTTQLNALKGFLALALIHHGSDHPRWGHLLERIGGRNLIVIRLDPDFAETLGWPVFDKTLPADERIFFGETLWLPQKPDHPDNDFSICPECQGTGNLLDAVGTFPDTRLMQPYED